MVRLPMDAILLYKMMAADGTVSSVGEVREPVFRAGLAGAPSNGGTYAQPCNQPSSPCPSSPA